MEGLKSELKKNETKKLPLITVVTVVYNGEDTIEGTIISCIEQTYPKLEYVVIDGSSSDSTVEIISRYANQISHFISEPDTGIYDAMNKAIKVASGDWIIFMNSGDIFYDLNVLEDVARTINKNSSNVDIIYGNTLYKYATTLLKIIPKPIESILSEMTFCHQSCFVKIDLVKRFPFDVKYRLAADYNMIYQFYKHHNRFLYYDRIISVFNQEDGATLINYKQSLRELLTIQGYNNSLKDEVVFYYKLWRIELSNLLKKKLSKNITEYIFKKKNEKRIFK